LVTCASKAASVLAVVVVVGFDPELAGVDALVAGAAAAWAV
jgi:hypothetical protein